MPFSPNTLAINIVTILVVSALLYPYCLKDRARLTEIATIYRPLALTFLLLNPILILSEPFTTRAVFPIATTSIGASMAFLALEIRSTRKSVSNKVLWTVLVAFIIVSVFAEIRWNFGNSLPKNAIAAVSLVTGLILWTCVEAILAYLAKRQGHYLFVIVAALIAAGGMFARTWIVAFEIHTFDTLILFENEQLFLTRALTVSGLLGMSVALGQLYLDNEWKSEEWSRKKAESGLLTTLGALSLVRDTETGHHIQRTSEFVKLIGREMERRGLIKRIARHDLIEIMSQAAPLHDIGKIGIPDAILKKPGRLDEDEWNIMKTHSTIGEEVLKTAGDATAERDTYTDLFMRVSVEIAGGHHENWNGSGYPRGLVGENIPVAARIMAVADMYDALTSPRVYKHAWPHEEAISEIRNLSGEKFDPQVVEVLVALESEVASIAEKYKD